MPAESRLSIVFYLGCSKLFMLLLQMVCYQTRPRFTLIAPTWIACLATALMRNTQHTSSCFQLDTMGKFNDDFNNEHEKMKNKLLNPPAPCPAFWKTDNRFLSTKEASNNGGSNQYSTGDDRPECSLRVFDSDKTKLFKAFTRSPKKASADVFPSPISGSQCTINNCTKLCSMILNQWLCECLI